MNSQQLREKAIAWIKLAAPELKAVISHKPRTPSGAQFPAAHVGKPSRPFATVELAADVARFGTHYTRTTDQELGADPKTENRFRHEIHGRRRRTCRIRIFADDAMDLALKIHDSRVDPAIRAHLRAAEIAITPLADPIDISDDTRTAWEERAQLDVGIHYLLTRLTESPIIESATVIQRTWRDGRDQDTDPPDSEDTYQA